MQTIQLSNCHKNQPNANIPNVRPPPRFLYATSTDVLRNDFPKK
ncbi:MAG: hypothetical protein ACOYOT_01340 [Bacteroidales bacterium]